MTLTKIDALLQLTILVVLPTVLMVERARVRLRMWRRVRAG
jgi:hypothetical protein